MSVQNQVKKKPSDFKFGKCIGEGSFSEVFLAREINTNQEFAIKVLMKRQILREKKQKYVHREKEVLLKLDHPFFIKLHFTFQDEEKLYFGLSYACNGELLDHIKHLGKFDLECARFYSAEIITALEYLHSLNIIHRDMKPENILLDAFMHIQITDFGSAKILTPEEMNCSEPVQESTDQNKISRRHSFVGTAQYVSPEVLNNYSCFSSDLWALGCIIYQFLAGTHPFNGSNEYQIFNKIIKLEYSLPSEFDESAKDLIKNLLVLQPNKRLGCSEMGGYPLLKSHSFFLGTPWEGLENECPPLKPSMVPLKKKMPVDSITVMTKSIDLKDAVPILFQPNNDFIRRDSLRTPGSPWFTKDERSELLKKQALSNAYHRFVEGNLIIKQGILYKKKGLIPRRRMFLLTEGPRLFYVDTANLILKGEVPWSRELRPEAKDFKVFHLHTPNRIYFLEDPEGNALKWCAQIEDVTRHFFDSS